MIIGTIFAALYAAHSVADHWVQTSHQADHKGCDAQHGTDGDHFECDASGSRAACVRHVAGYTLTALIFVGAAIIVGDLSVSLTSVAVGLTLSGLTHYVADRRAPLKRLAELVGRGEFYRVGLPRAGRDDNPTIGTGSYALDQSFHVLWLFVAALIIGA